MSASTGGIGRHVASVAARLAAGGDQVRIYGPAPTARAVERLDPSLVVHSLSKFWRLAGADVVHAHGYKAAALALPVARLTRTPLVVTWHNEILAHPGRHPDLRTTLGRALQQLVARGATLTLGASSDLVERARRSGARRVVLSPVAAPALAPAEVDRAHRRAEIGLGPDDLLVLTVGRLAPQKNLDLVLDLAAASGDPRLRFVVVGAGPGHSSLAVRIAAELLPVLLAGASDDVASWLAAADLALLTSTWEARSLAAQEALIAGVPLISTRVGGIEELVGPAAELFALDDVADGVRRLRALADDPEARVRLSDLGRDRAATWPDEDAVARDLRRTYRAVARP